MVSGTRPSALNASQLERFLALRDGSPHDLYANLFGYYQACDTKQWDRAGEYLDLVVQMRNTTLPKFSDAILLEKAYFEAFHRQNVQARTWLGQVKGERIEKHTRWRAETAVLYIEGHYAEAIAKAEAALAEVPKSVDRGGSLAEADLLKMLSTECQKHLIPESDCCSEVS